MDQQVLTAVALSCAIAACFDPAIDFCGPCSSAGSCPDGAACVAGLCVYDDQRCVPRDRQQAAADVDASMQPDAGSVATCGAEGTGIEAEPKCWDQCCIGDNEYVFPDAIKQGLVLWLDASYLPGLSAGGELDVWRDRSAGGHDARAPGSPPRVGTNAVHIDDTAQVLTVEHHARHDLGREDFVLLLAFSLPEPAQYQCLIAKAVPRQHGFFVNVDKLGAVVLTLYGGACDPAQGCLRLRSGATSLAPDRLQLLGIRRIHGAHLELRLNGEVVADAQLALDHSLTSAAPLALGSCAAADSSRLQGALFAAILVRATVSDVHLAGLEAYLVRALDPAL